MSYSNLLSENNNIEEDQQNEGCVFNCKPFKGKSSDTIMDSPWSSDLGEIGCQSENSFEISSKSKELDNPFAEHCDIFKKVKLNFSKVSEINESWSRKSFTLLKNNGLVRSAPLSFGSSFWDSENNGERITLPVLGCGRSDSIKRISGVTLVNLLNGHYRDDFVLVDARFKYEYDGGHVTRAINVNTEDDILKRIPSNKIIIFYCELSSVRGPGLAQKLRNRDRILNKYPTLSYPEIYVLEGGYRKFYQNFPDFCSPKSYIQMSDKRFKRECVYNHKVLKLNKSK